MGDHIIRYMRIVLWKRPTYEMDAKACQNRVRFTVSYMLTCVKRTL